MTDSPLRGLALRQRILIAQGTAYLAAGILTGASVVLSIPATLILGEQGGLLVLLLALGTVIWILLVLVALKRFGDAEDLGTGHNTETPGESEVVS